MNEWEGGGGREGEGEGEGGGGVGVKSDVCREEREKSRDCSASNDSPPQLPDAVTMRAKLRG